MDTSEYDYLFKVVVIGDSGVGKSSICTRYTKNMYNDMFITTIGVDFECHTISLDDKIIKLQIWDTAGQERFNAITNSFYRGAHGIIIVFDVTNWESFSNVQKWLKEIELREPDVPYKLIVGNKCDQNSKRVITFEAANEYANKLNIPYLETSAKVSVNVDQAFLNMASEIKTRIIANTLQNSNNPRCVQTDLQSSYHTNNKPDSTCCQLL